MEVCDGGVTWVREVVREVCDGVCNVGERGRCVMWVREGGV